MLHDEEQTSVSQERTFLLCNLIHLSYVTAQSLWSLHLPHVTGKRFPVWVNSAIQRTSCVWPDTSRHGVKVFNYCVRLLFQIQNKSLKWSFRWNMYSVFYLFIESFTCLKARHLQARHLFFHALVNLKILGNIASITFQNSWKKTSNIHIFFITLYLVVSVDIFTYI